MSLSTNSASTSTQSLAQLVLAYEEWTRRREGPPSVLPPRCISMAVAAKHAGGKYSDGFGDNEISIPCMVTLAYLTRRPTIAPGVYTCALPSGEKLCQQDQSDDVKNAKQAATRVESAKSEGNAAAAQTAMTELRQIVDRVFQKCLQA